MLKWILAKKKLISKISSLRGGDLIEVIGTIIFISILLAIQSLSFQPNPRVIVPPHLEWLYGNNPPGHHFGHNKNGGPRSITVRGLTRNASSDKKNSSGSWEYSDIMSILDQQKDKKTITINIADEIYIFKNPDHDNTYESCYTLDDKLADLIYDSIRESDTDIGDIASNLNFDLKATDIKSIKDHVFHREHKLDRYVSYGQEPEYRRFDPSIQQALAWKRLESNTHTDNDITWLRHEYLEQEYELKYNSGYSEAHDWAQTHFDGFPWKDDF